MRSTKYHDYRVLKIALFIILVILGLFIYIKCTRALHEHTGDQTITIKEATCTEDGLGAKICADPECEGAHYDEYIIPATGHNGKWKTVKEATCNEQGTKCEYCTVCSKILKTEYTDPKGHNEVIDKAVEPTCTTTGLTEGKHCKVCGVTTSEQEIIDVVDHVAGEYITIQEATCVKVGYKVKYCTECNQQIADTKVEITVIDHKYVVLPETEVVISDPTCTEYGVTTVKAECTMCKDSMTIRLEDGIKPLGHNYTTWELVYNSEKGEFAMIGSCNCDEDGNKVTKSAADGLKIEPDTTPDCCSNRYTGTIVIDGIEITRTIELETEDHKVVKIKSSDFEEEYVYVSITEYKKEDPEYGVYYDLSEVKNLGYYISDDNKWDENGFAWGAFKCVQCVDMECPVCNSGEVWYVVRIYDAARDTGLSGESVDD